MSLGREPVAPSEAPPPRVEVHATPLVNLLSALHRLLKVARMYDKKNQALQGSAEAVVAATAEYCAAQSIDSADVMFANETVFVNGRMLPMPREVYARVMELGAVLEHCDIANVNVARAATVADLVSFAHALGAALRDPERKADVALPKYGGVRARQLRWRAMLEGEAEQSPVTVVVRTYASAVVALRRFHADLSSGQRAMPLSLRRLAQRIVADAERAPSVLVALASAQETGTDAATLAVTTTLVAVLMARQLSDDREALTDLALAGLVHDLGDLRLRALASATPGHSHESPLSPEDYDRLPAAGAFFGLSLEAISERTIPRTVISFEAHWHAHAARLGAMYGGKRPASVLARILATARAFSLLLAPGPHAAHVLPGEALTKLESQATDDTARAYVRLLTAGLGIFPVGTPVELNSGEIAVVVRVPDHSVDFARPPVRVVYDAAGAIVRDPVDLDLAARPAPGHERRTIRRSIEMDAQQKQAMREAVLGKSREPGRPPPRPSMEMAAIPPPARAPAPSTPDAAPSARPSMEMAAIPPPARAPAPSTPDAAPSTRPSTEMAAVAPPVRPRAPSTPDAAPPARSTVAPEAARSRPTVNPEPLRPLPKRPTIHPSGPRPAETGRVRPTISPGALRPQDAVSPASTMVERPSSVPGADPTPEAKEPASVIPAPTSSAARPPSSNLTRTRYVLQHVSESNMPAVTPPPAVTAPDFEAGDTLKTSKPQFQPEPPEPLSSTAPAGVALRRPNISFASARDEVTKQVDWRSYGDVVADSTSSATGPDADKENKKEKNEKKERSSERAPRGTDRPEKPKPSK